MRYPAVFSGVWGKSNKYILGEEILWRNKFRDHHTDTGAELSCVRAGDEEVYPEHHIVRNAGIYLLLQGIVLHADDGRAVGGYM